MFLQVGVGFLFVCLGFTGGPSTSSGSVGSARAFLPRDAVNLQTIGYWTRPVLSPDKEWVAYTVHDHTRGTATDERYRVFSPTGALSTNLNSDIWLVNTKTRESTNLTNGNGTNWGPVGRLMRSTLLSIRTVPGPPQSGFGYVKPQLCAKYQRRYCVPSNRSRAVDA